MKILNTILRFIFKQKKFAVFFLSALIIIGILLPHMSLAFNENISAKNICRSKKNILLQSGPELINLVIGSTVGCFDYYLAYTVAWIGSGTVGIFHALASGASSLFKASLSVTSYGITREDTTFGKIFYDAWAQVRNWANILVVLGFIGIALAFMMNLEQYKKLLAPLLLVAVLLNFSVVFVGLIIDASNIITNQFVQGAGNNGNLIFNINKTWNKTLYSFPVNSISDSFIYLGLSVVMAIAYFMIAMTFFTLAIIFIERFVFLAILFIFSPLAFVFYVFPLSSTKKLFSMWWEHFIKWAFVGIIGLLFLDLTSRIVAASGKIYEFNVLQAPEKITAQLGTVFMHLLIVLIFLYIAIKMTFKASGWASGFIIAASLATGTFLAAKGAKGAIRNVGLERAYNTTKEGVSAGLERIGLRPSGATEAMRKRRAAALTPQDKALLEGMTPRQLVATARGQTTRLGFLTEGSMRRKSAAITKAFEKGLLKNLPQPEQEKLARYAISTDRSNAAAISKSNADLAHLDPDRMQALRIKNPGATQTELTDMAHRDAYASMKVENIDNMSDQDIIERSKELDAAGNVTAEAAKHLEEAVKRNILSLIGNFTETANLLKNAKDRLGSNGLIKAVDSNPQYIRHHSQAVDRKLADMRLVDPSTTRAQAEQSAVNEQYQRSKVLDLSKDALSPDIPHKLDFLLNVKAKPLDKAFERMGAGKIDELKKFITRGTPESKKILKKATELNMLGTPEAKRQRKELYKVLLAIKMA